MTQNKPSRIDRAQSAAHPSADPEAPSRLVLVTGPSGAGRSTAINALEDLGYETIDNMPLLLLPRLYDGAPLRQPLALGIDVRNRDFGTDAMIDLLNALTDDPAIRVDLVYLDCAQDVLLRRYSETRRRQPMNPEGAPRDGIAREIELLTPIRDRSDILINTSEMTVHDLRAEIGRQLSPEGGTAMSVSIQSFSYKRGVPRGADMVLDCRFLNNPHWDPKLRALDGRSAEVADFVAADPRFHEFFEKTEEMVNFLLPAYRTEGKTHFSIGFGCTGGQHRSVAVAEALANTLAKAGWQVSKRHRELDRRSGGPGGQAQGDKA